MKLLVFLGAGVSVPSQLPTAMELTEKLFQSSAIDIEETSRVRGLLKLLREYDTADIPRAGLYQHGEGFRASGAIYRGPASTYEDLFYLCQEITLWCMGLSDNSQTTPFMEGIERRAGELLNGASFDARMNDLAKLGRPACSYIETVAAETLRREYVAGFDLLLELALDPAVEELNIATLNHDTLVEQFLSANGIEYVDGFGERDGDVRWSDDRVYENPRSKIRLLKLHGSVNWYSFKHGSGLKTAILVGNDPSCARDASGTELRSERLSPSFLSGLNKSVSYHRGFYADVHFRFLELLRRCNRMIMSGYGWGDTAINFQLETWLDSLRDNKLILLHTEPRQLIDRSVILATSYDGWLRSGRLTALEQWLANTSLSDLRDLTTW
jgi:SIR2-like domain